MKHIQDFESFLGEAVKFKKGDKVKTREGNVETVIRVNSNGNVETEESDYTWPADSLTKVNEAYGDRRDYPKLHIIVNGEYLATTTWAKNKKEAKDKYLEKNPKTDPKAVEILTDAEFE